MHSGHDEIRDSLEQALQALANEKGRELAGRLRPILLANLDRGRIEGFTGGKPELVREYVWRVADGFIRHSTYLHDIQSTKASEDWEPLFKQMQLWAYNFLIRKGSIPGLGTQEISFECATEAALSLVNAHFPYDIAFEAWAHIIVQNACRKYFRQGQRKSAIPEENFVDLDDMLDNLADPASGEREQPNNLAADLLDAISRLPETRRHVIEAIYFDGLRPAEIAKEMGKSVGAVHSLLFNTLRDLRKILSKIRNNINE